ncbi:MAG: glutamyl-tRNA reductase [Ahniella sp.]|nr:glutamyl-tRNA reductase [Ahniella sp.]
MPIFALGLNHQTAPITLREKVALAPERFGDALESLKSSGSADEAVLISTCNRTELFLTGDETSLQRCTEWLHQYFDLNAGALDSFTYCHRDRAAIRHLYRVASGLDSMVLGEPQILGQVKRAHSEARQAGAVRTSLDRLFQTAFSVAKRVRTETSLGSSPVSVAFSAVRLATRIFADLAGSNTLLVGAGETIELVARHLQERGVRHLTIANRTLANARSLAEEFEARAVALADLDHVLPEADIVVACTASTTPVITFQAIQRALKARRRKPMLVLDLGVPRDVESQVGTLDDAYLYTVDDIGAMIEESMKSRRDAAAQGEAIIDLQAEHFVSWLKLFDAQGAIRGLRDRADRERADQLQKAKQALAQGRSPEEALELLAHGLTNKLLHAPTVALREAAKRADVDLLRAASRLFELDDPGVK